MSTEIKLLESIRDKLDTGFQLLSGQIGETNFRLGQVEASLSTRIDKTNAKLDLTIVKIGEVETGLGARIDQTNARIDETNAKLGHLETGLGARIDDTNATLRGMAVELEATNRQLFSSIEMQSDSSITVSSRVDENDKRITSLEHRVDKLEEAG